MWFYNYIYMISDQYVLQKVSVILNLFQTSWEWSPDSTPNPYVLLPPHPVLIELKQQSWRDLIKMV
jgi:hypothetical protein